MKSKHTFFKNSYIPSTIIKWDQLDQDVRNAESYVLFRKHLLSFNRPEANSTFNVLNAKRIELLTRLRVGFTQIPDMRNAESYVLFRKHLLSFIIPEANSILNVHNTKRINF